MLVYTKGWTYPKITKIDNDTFERGVPADRHRQVCDGLPKLWHFHASWEQVEWKL